MLDTGEKQGSTRQALTKSLIQNFQVTYPDSLVEQKRIVSILDEAFGAIERAKENAQKNLANAREIFESYLNRVFTEKGEGWEEGILGEVADVRDGTHDSPTYVPDGVPFVTQKNIRLDGLCVENTKCISQEDHEKIYQRSNVTFGDILISMIGANRGMACIVDSKAMFSIKNVGLIKKGEVFDQSFLLYYLKSSSGNKYVGDASRGGAQSFIGLKKLRAFPVPIAPKAHQETLVSKLTDLDEATQELTSSFQQKLTALEELKQSILQKAFTGRLTAKSPELEAVG